MVHYRLSPAYDLLNSRIHINDRDFALKDGLLSKTWSKQIRTQFLRLGEQSRTSEMMINGVFLQLLLKSLEVGKLVVAFYLDETTKRKLLASLSDQTKTIK